MTLEQYYNAIEINDEKNKATELLNAMRTTRGCINDTDGIYQFTCLGGEDRGKQINISGGTLYKILEKLMEEQEERIKRLVQKFEEL